MKAIFNRIISRVHSSTAPNHPEVQEARRERKMRSREDQMTSMPSDEEEEESEVVDILIKMKNTLKITRINSSLQGEYQTLRHINRMLCSNPLKSGEIRTFLLAKSSQKIDFDEELDCENTQNRILTHYTLYSNGLIYQYYSVRALLWKVSLGYLPAAKNKWVSYMEGNLIEYHELVNEHIIQFVKRKKRKEILENKKERKESIEEKPQKSPTKKQPLDHPLNILKQSKWKTLFEDRQLWAIIQKDTLRTKPNCKFFREQNEIEIDESERHGVAQDEIHLSKQNRRTFYHDCLTRIIYLFIKTHPQYSYCQGMNQMAAIVFYSFANKNSQYFRRVAESDAFFCFQKIMKEISKLPIPGFLNGEKYSLRFEELLKKVDLRLYEELQEKKGTLNSLRILSIKWFGSFFLNQYDIDESLILWDGFMATLFKEESPTISFHNLLLSVGLAIVHLNRTALSEGQNPMLVFSKVPNGPEELLEKATSLYKIFWQFF